MLFKVFLVGGTNREIDRQIFVHGEASLHTELALTKKRKISIFLYFSMHAKVEREASLSFFLSRAAQFHLQLICNSLKFKITGLTFPSSQSALSCRASWITHTHSLITRSMQIVRYLYLKGRHRCLTRKFYRLARHINHANKMSFSRFSVATETVFKCGLSVFFRTFTALLRVQQSQRLVYTSVANTL